MTEKIRELMYQAKPADYWQHGATSESDALCPGCGLYVNELQWIFCAKCKENICMWCANSTTHQLHGPIQGNGETFVWSVTSEPVDFALFAKCNRETCGHFALVHENKTGRCMSCDARQDPLLACEPYVPSLQVEKDNMATDTAKFWAAFDKACMQMLQTYVKEDKKKPVKEREPKDPFTDRTTLMRVCKKLWGWDYKTVDLMLQQAHQAKALVSTPAHTMTQSRFLGKYVPVYLRQQKPSSVV